MARYSRFLRPKRSPSYWGGSILTFFLLSCLWSFVEGYEITSGNIHFSPALRKAPTYPVSFRLILK